MTASLEPSFAFTGREWDPEIELYFYRARYYDPHVGRFISSDPIGPDGGFNTYAYVDNNPLSYIDPDGLYKTSPKVPDPKSSNPVLHAGLICMDACMGSQVYVTATTNGTHGVGSPHYEGKAADILPGGGSQQADQAVCCALKCKFVFVLDEYKYPSRRSSGGHIHVQTRPGLNGATGTGSKPTPQCCNR